MAGEGSRRPCGPPVNRSGLGRRDTMKTITAIMVVAVGAILTFAINAHPGFISPQIVGLVLMR